MECDVSDDCSVSNVSHAFHDTALDAECTSTKVLGLRIRVTSNRVTHAELVGVASDDESEAAVREQHGQRLLADELRDCSDGWLLEVA